MKRKSLMFLLFFFAGVAFAWVEDDSVLVFDVGATNEENQPVLLPLTFVVDGESADSVLLPLSSSEDSDGDNTSLESVLNDSMSDFEDGSNQFLLSSSICSAPDDIPVGRDGVADELVVFKGPVGCGQRGGNDDPYCQKMYYCVDGQVVNLNFKNSGGNDWGLVSTAAVPGNKLRSGDGRTPEGTFVIMDFDRTHSYAPQGFMRLNTAPVIGYNSGIAVHDIRSDGWIGKRRSEGCVRTYGSDMKILRTKLQVGDPVTIIGLN